MNILLVDDDADVRESLARFLSDEGHKVSLEAGGDGAMSRYINRGPFDFILTDFQFIPGKTIRNGADFVREVLQSNPEQRIAIMTGDHWAAQKALDKDSVKVTVLKKPFKLQELTDLISKA